MVSEELADKHKRVYTLATRVAARREMMVARMITVDFEKYNCGKFRNAIRRQMGRGE